MGHFNNRLLSLFFKHNSDWPCWEMQFGRTGKIEEKEETMVNVKWLIGKI